MNKRLIFLFLLLFSATSTLLFAQEAQTKPENRSVQDVDETTLLLDDGQTKQDAAAQADTQQNGQQRDTRITSFTVWDFVRMILVLGAVIGLIYVVFYFLKKRGAPNLQNNELFTILSSQAVANNRALHLVQVGNQYFLVGSGEHAVNLISEIDDKETIDEIRLKMSNVRSGEKKNFRNIFSGILGQGGANRLDGSVNTDTAFIRKQRERLKRM